MAFGEFTGLLIHTAVVYRRQEVGGEQKKDPFGQPTRDELPSHRVACRVTAASGGERNGERMRDVVETRHRLFLDRGADIREDDVVTVLDAGIKEVDRAAEADRDGYVDEFHNIVTRAEVHLARRAVDGIGEHHREATLVTQRQSGEAR